MSDLEGKIMMETGRCSHGVKTNKPCAPCACTFSAGCPKPNICREIGHCDFELQKQAATPLSSKDVVQRLQEELDYGAPSVGVAQLLTDAIAALKPVETSEPPHELRPLLDNGLKALDAGVPIQPTSYFHEELKRLLAMPSEEPRETLARRCHCGEFEMQPDMALITDTHAHDHVFDGTKCDCEDTPECNAVEPTPPLNAAEMGTVARMAAVAARVQPVKATASQKCEWGCHVHWSGWPTSHHPSCTVNGEPEHG